MDSFTYINTHIGWQSIVWSRSHTKNNHAVSVSTAVKGAAGDGNLELGQQPSLAYDHTTTGSKTRVYNALVLQITASQSVYGEWLCVFQTAFYHITQRLF